MPFQQSIDDIEIYRELRLAIDNSNLGEIERIFYEHPLLNWNHVTPNGLSALWWALSPPRGKPINRDIVSFLLHLERNHQRVIDPSQQYANLRPDYYVDYFGTDDRGNLNRLIGMINEAQDVYAMQHSITQQGVDNQLATDTHSASNPFIVRASDENLKRLYQRYGKQLVIDNELTDLEAFITTTQFKAAFPLVFQQQQIHKAIERFKTNPTSRSEMSPEQGPCNLKAALALTWLAAKETHADLVPNADPLDRQKAVLTALFEAQTTYGNNSPSCWLGTWGRIGTALSYMHNDVHYQSNIKLTGELARNKFATLIGDKLAQAYEQDRSSYWALVCTKLGRETKEERDYAERFWKEKVALIQKEMREANVDEKEIETLLVSENEMEKLIRIDLDSLPLSRHEPSRQLALLQKFFQQRQKANLFVLSRSDDINQALTALKLAYLERCLRAPDEISKLKLDDAEIAAFKNWVLDTLLERNNEDEEINETDLWEVVSTQIKIDKLKDERLTRWYQTLELSKQITIAKDCLKKDSIRCRDLVELALTHACIAGLVLKGMDLSKVDLDFRGWDLSRIDFRGADLRGADLKLIDANETLWEGCNLAGADFNQFIQVEALIGSVHCSKELLSKRANFNRTVLHTAIMRHNLAQVNLILKSPHCSKEMLLLQNNAGETVLHHAIFYSNEVSFNTILQSPHCSKEMLLLQDNAGQTALHRAVDAGIAFAIPILESLHCSKKMLLRQNNYGETALHLAASSSTDILNAILKSPHCSKKMLLHQDTLGRTALYLVIFSRKESRLNAILPHCSKKMLLLQENNGKTALHQAVINDVFVTPLLQPPHCSKEMLLLQDNDGKTALFAALQVGELYQNNLAAANAILESSYCTEDVLKAKRSNAQAGLNGQTVLHWAVESKSFARVDMLLKSSKCSEEVLSVKNSQGSTALHVAVFSSVEIQDAILPHCSEKILLLQDNKGETALHMAVNKVHNSRDNRNLNFVKQIISSKHCTEQVLAVKDLKGRTALDLAISYDNKNILNILSRRILKIEPSVPTKNTAILASKAMLKIATTKKDFLNRLNNFLKQENLTREDILSSHHLLSQ